MADITDDQTDGATVQPPKLAHTIILDSSPLLLNSPPLSALLANSAALFTTQSVISEIKDRDARDRIQTLYQSFITLRQPKPESVKFVREFSQTTGDAAVLSRADIEVVALAYELECERNGGDWRLRRVPGQKRLNGSPPRKEEIRGKEQPETSEDQTLYAARAHLQDVAIMSPSESAEPIVLADDELSRLEPHDSTSQKTVPEPASENVSPLETMPPVEVEELSSDSDSAEWITPSNIKKHQAKEDAALQSTKSEIKTLQVATITGDFAMQNVLLQMNLNLLSPATCKRIAHIKQTILRCHGCFATTKDMTKQFCPRCGNPTLTRVSCTTNDKGEVKLHLKANMQWNNKGNVFSIPKPVAGSANQKWKGPRHGGGKEGWGSGLIMAEDQKEYIQAMSSNSRAVKKDLMDDDYLPSILTGDRNRGNGRVKVGAGRNVNSRKK